MSNIRAQHAALDARDDMLWIADHWAALQARLCPGGGNAQNGLVSTSGDAPLPIDVSISDLMFQIEENVARFYGKILMDETDWEPTTSAMPTLLTEVARRYGHFTADPVMALGFADDASDYREKVRKTLNQPEPATYIGPCQTRNCGGDLYVGAGRTTGKCRECGTAFTVAEQREWLLVQLEGRLMTQAEIPRALSILGLRMAPGTVRKWVERGTLVEAVTGSGLYRLADAKALSERVHGVHLTAA